MYQKISLQKLKETLKIVKGAPYYKRLYKNIKLARLTVKDFALFPLANHKDLADDPLSFVPTANIKKIQAVFTSSGYTGKPKFYYLTKQDIMVRGKTAAYFFRNFIKPQHGDKILFIVPAGPHGSGIMVHAYAQALNAPYLIVDAFLAERAISILSNNKQFKFNTLITGNAMALILLRSCREKGISPKALGIKKMSLGGAALSRETRRQIENSFGCRVYHNYGLSESDIIGVECDCHAGYRILPSRAVFIEIINEKGQPSDRGELILTCFNRGGTQIIRYKTGDLVSWVKEDCQCHYKTPMIKVLGRSDEMFVVGHLNLYWTAELDNAISNIPVRDYRIEILHDRCGKDVLKFYLENEKPVSRTDVLLTLKKVDLELVTQIEKGLLGLEVVNTSDIKTLPGDIKGVKFIRIVDKRENG